MIDLNTINTIPWYGKLAIIAAILLLFYAIYQTGVIMGLEKSKNTFGPKDKIN